MTPPRAARSRQDGSFRAAGALGGALYKGKLSLVAGSLVVRRRARSLALAARPWRIALAGLMPGLGHTLSGAPRRGAAFAGGIVALVGLGALLFGGLLGQALFGLALGVHAMSIFELTPVHDDPRPPVRIGVSVAISLLLALAYWPLVTRLANAMIQRRVINLENRSALLVSAVAAAAIAGAAVLLIQLVRSGRLPFPGRKG